MEKEKSSQAKNPIAEKVKNLFSSLDAFGEEYKFNVDGRDQFKTKTGALVTIIFLGLFGFSAYSSIKFLFDTTNPDVSVTSVISSVSP